MTALFAVLRCRLAAVVSLLILFLVPLLLAGCARSPTMLRPAASDAVEIANLFWGVTAIAVVIFIFVEVWLIYTLIRFRDRPGAPEPSQVHGNIRLEVVWTIVPAVIVIGIFIATVSTMAAVGRERADALPVKVIAHQWWWEVQYPDRGITTATDIHVPVGREVRFELVSNDVIHSFWIPELAGKLDVNPGHTNYLQFTVDREGVYRGQCAEFCGVQHANMGLEIMAEPPEKFDEWVRGMQITPTIPTTDQAGRGAEAFLKGACMGCHTIDGTAARGKVGPNLTHFGSRRSLASLTVENTPENLAAWLADPQKVKPGNRMVMPPLRPETIQDLVAFLQGLK